MAAAGRDVGGDVDSWADRTGDTRDGLVRAFRHP